MCSVAVGATLEGPARGDTRGLGPRGAEDSGTNEHGFGGVLDTHVERCVGLQQNGLQSQQQDRQLSQQLNQQQDRRSDAAELSSGRRPADRSRRPDRSDEIDAVARDSTERAGHEPARVVEPRPSSVAALLVSSARQDDRAASVIAEGATIQREEGLIESSPDASMMPAIGGDLLSTSSVGDGLPQPVVGRISNTADVVGLIPDSHTPLSNDAGFTGEGPAVAAPATDQSMWAAGSNAAVDVVRPAARSTPNDSTQPTSGSGPDDGPNVVSSGRDRSHAVGDRAESDRRDPGQSIALGDSGATVAADATAASTSIRNTSSGGGDRSATRDPVAPPKVTIHPSPATMTPRNAPAASSTVMATQLDASSTKAAPNTATNTATNAATQGLGVGAVTDVEGHASEADSTTATESAQNEVRSPRPTSAPAADFPTVARVAVVQKPSRLGDDVGGVERPKDSSPDAPVAALATAVDGARLSSPLPDAVRTTSAPSLSTTPDEQQVADLLTSDTVAVVRPLRDRDGTHSISIELHPAELGRVRIDLEMRFGVAHVVLSAEHASADAILRLAMPQLREALNGSGVRTGRLDIGADLQRGTDPGPGSNGPNDASTQTGSGDRRDATFASTGARRDEPARRRGALAVGSFARDATLLDLLL